MALHLILLSLSSSDSFNIMNKKITMDHMVELIRIFEKTSTSNNVFLMKRLFNMKMVYGNLVVEHLNNFHTDEAIVIGCYQV